MQTEREMVRHALLGAKEKAKNVSHSAIGCDQENIFI
jgi:hypothetical protein